ncbi:hypothetical protein ID866_10126 [Astraeus odoratus]|nr:hypothetical protein ID866_10126 [Astraeus odoratus]
MSSNAIHDKRDLDALFPNPTFPPSAISPQRLPGTNFESVAALRHVLKDNHKRWHIFLNHIKFHNHITHHALAIYAMGGSGTLIRTLYEQDTEAQRPAIVSPEVITPANFITHLGDENYYQGYVSFFSEEIDRKGTATVLEEYIFSEDFQSRGIGPNQPEMLSRFTAGLLHALIHVGHGLEFGLKGMVVEGLAMTAVHDADEKSLFPGSFFVTGSQATEEATRLVTSLAVDDKAFNSTILRPRGTHVFDVIARILSDDRLKPHKGENAGKDFMQTLNEYAAEIRHYAAQWTIDTSKPGEVEKKMEELIWTSSVLYAVGGFSNVKGFTAEFFFMHLVTSSLFLPSFIPYLNPRSQELLLRAYLTMILTWWIARGRPSLDIKSFMTSTPTQPPMPTQGVSTSTAETHNPFLPVIQSAIIHPNDHLSKIQRSFAHFSTVYGDRQPGYFKNTELEGAEHLDGSLFTRAAILTADSMGWGREDQPARMWNFDGFFET